METITMGGIIHLASEFKDWEDLFLGHVDNKTQVDNGNFIYAQVDDKRVLIILKDVDPVEMNERMQDPNFAKLVEGIVDHHELYQMQPMGPPQ